MHARQTLADSQRVTYPQWQRAQGTSWSKRLMALLVFGLCYAGLLWLLRSGVILLGWERSFERLPWMLLLLNLTLMALIPASLLAVRLGFRHPVGSLLSLWQRLRWGWLLRAWVVGWLAMGPLLLLDLFVVAPHPLHVRGELLWPLAMLIVLTPLQCAGEELAFRGLAAQWVGSWLRDRRVACMLSLLLPSLLFALVHGQQDVPLFFARFGLGMVFGWVTWRTGGLEAAIALHTLNNQTAFLNAIVTNRLREALFTSGVDWLAAIMQLGLEGLAAWLVLRAYRRHEAPQWAAPEWPEAKKSAMARPTGPD